LIRIAAALAKFPKKPGGGNVGKPRSSARRFCYFSSEFLSDFSFARLHSPCEPLFYKPPAVVCWFFFPQAAFSSPLLKIHFPGPSAAAPFRHQLHSARSEIVLQHLSRLAP
jgi:hypothetical protein